MNLFIALFLFYLKAITVYGQARIANGQSALGHQLPYQVLISSNKGLCGGSIIHKYWILTAGHCKELFKDMPRIRVLVGTTRISGKDGVVYRAKAFIRHENYTANMYEIDNDIGLIRLKNLITFNNKIKSIKLPESDLQNNETPLAVISGWGITNISFSSIQGVSQILQYTSVRIISPKKCNKLWKNLRDGHICTSITGGKSACVGDSGGPVAVNGTQVGIVSFGDDYCGLNLPNVHTRVFSYVPWIKSKLALYSDSLK